MYKKLLNLMNIKEESINLPVSRYPEDGQMANRHIKKVLSIANHQGNANQRTFTLVATPPKEHF